MGFRGNVRPGKAASVLGVLAGLLFGILGVVMVMPAWLASPRLTTPLSPPGPRSRRGR